MRTILSLMLLIGSVLSSSGSDSAVAPPPRVKPLLKCEVCITGKFEYLLDGIKYTHYSPDVAVVTITNISNGEVDIGSKWGPDAHFDLRMKDPTGADVKTEPWSDRLAIQTLLKAKPYVLKPGEMYQMSIGLLDTMPEEKRVAGTYKAKAVYSIGNSVAESAWIEVKWPGNKK